MLAHNYKPPFTCCLFWDIISPLQTSMYTCLSSISYPSTLSSDQVRHTCTAIVSSSYFQPSTDHYFYLPLSSRDRKLLERPTPHPVPISTEPILSACSWVWAKSMHSEWTDKHFYEREHLYPGHLTSEISKWKSKVFPGSSLETLLKILVKDISGEPTSPP